MRHRLLFLMLFFIGLTVQAQVGQTTLTFNDPGRTGGFGSGSGSGRQIQTEIYYPATSAGQDTPPQSGTFPVVVFGHGFTISWDAYQNVWDTLVANNYIVAFPRTEGGFLPDHEDFGLDLALCVDSIQALNTNGASILNGHIATETAIAGHSMGGGSTILAASFTNNIEAIMGFAPAETNPSAITAASSVTVPAVVFSGSADGVTPPGDHHIPIYDSLASDCKYFISITGGAHCYFANTNFNCDFGELTSSTGISVSRQDQQIIMNDYMIKWLNYYLKGDNSAKTDFNNLLTTDGRITFEESCSPATSIQETVVETHLFPNPAHDHLRIQTGQPMRSIRLYNELGQLVMTEPVSSHQECLLNISALSEGLYLLELELDSGQRVKEKLVVRR